MKNNLVIVNDILTNHPVNNREDFNQAIQATQSRIKSISLIHRFLYMSENYETLNIADYFEALVNELKDLSFDRKNQHEVHLHCAPSLIEIERGRILGLILIELFNNSIKHAFTNAAGTAVKGKISIIFLEEDDSFRLIFADNGSGKLLSSSEYQKNTGLKLIEELSSRIHGSINVSLHGGTEFNITFPR